MAKSRKHPGTVYLIHFTQPYRAQSGNFKKQAQHYIGWAKDLDARMQQHRGGYGARLIEVIQNAGIEWDVVATWTGDRTLERKLKNRKNSRCICPVCRAAAEAARLAEKSQLTLSLS